MKLANVKLFILRSQLILTPEKRVFRFSYGAVYEMCQGHGEALRGTGGRNAALLRHFATLEAAAPLRKGRH